MDRLKPPTPVFATDCVVSSGPAPYVLLTFRSPAAGEVGEVGTPTFPAVAVAMPRDALPGFIKLLSDAHSAASMLED